MEAEESPLLMTREHLVKTQQAGKDLACTVVICKVWRLAMVLYLLVGLSVCVCVCVCVVNKSNIQSKTVSIVTTTCDSELDIKLFQISECYNMGDKGHKSLLFIRDSRQIMVTWVAHVSFHTVIHEELQSFSYKEDQI
jgi:hypothetical protein